MEAQGGSVPLLNMAHCLSGRHPRSTPEERRLEHNVKCNRKDERTKRTETATGQSEAYSTVCAMQ